MPTKAPSKTAATEDARARALAAFLESVNPKGADTLAAYTVFTAPASHPAISTRALTLDYALGIGGLPVGKIIELYGPESSGKTSLALSVCAEAIAAGGMVGYVDVEHAIEFKHAKNMGVDLNYFALSQPSSGEEALDMMEKMANSGNFPVVVCDSVAALVPQRELDGEIGDTHVGTTARLMSQTLKRLAGVAARTNTTLIFINQLREKIGVMHGNPETTPGGRALKYFAAVRMEVRSAASQRIRVGGATSEAIGQRCTVTIKKNKVAAPHKKAEYNLYFEGGIDTAETIVETAIETGVWTGNGHYYDAETGEKVGMGKDNLKKMIADDPEFAAATREKVIAALNAKTLAWMDDLFEADDKTVDPEQDLAPVGIDDVSELDGELVNV